MNIIKHRVELGLVAAILFIVILHSVTIYSVFTDETYRVHIVTEGGIDTVLIHKSNQKPSVNSYKTARPYFYSNGHYYYDPVILEYTEIKE